jgi:hypothetical protein
MVDGANYQVVRERETVELQLALESTLSGDSEAANGR